MMKQLARFSMVGALNTLVGVSVIFGLMAMGVGGITANALGYGVGLVVSFFLNRSWTFTHQGKGSHALIRFLTVFAVAYSCNLLLMITLSHGFHLNTYLAQGVGIVSFSAVQFVGCKWYAFAARNNPA